jgi:hypothetical protein
MAAEASDGMMMGVIWDLYGIYVGFIGFMGFTTFPNMMG